MPTIIEVKNLTKKFGAFAAVNDISFNVGRGEIFAFLGPNGAGKSTTIKMLITLLTPTSGEGIIDGKSITRNSAEVRRAIGYVPQLISIDGTLTASENLMLMARLYNISRAESKIRIAEILKFMSLEAQADALARTFSGGMIRKLEVGQAMIHQPHVLFLDEPTTGLDPIARQNVWDHLVELRDKFGTTIFFSTHNMEEADAVADRVAIMHSGTIAVIGSAEELKQKTGKADANLEDAFIFFTGNKLQQTGNFRDIKQARRNERRLG